jgi:hypothetical protein
VLDNQKGEKNTDKCSSPHSREEVIVLSSWQLCSSLEAASRLCGAMKVGKGGSPPRLSDPCTSAFHLRLTPFNRAYQIELLFSYNVSDILKCYQGLSPLLSQIQSSGICITGLIYLNIRLYNLCRTPGIKSIHPIQFINFLIPKCISS